MNTKLIQTVVFKRNTKFLHGVLSKLKSGAAQRLSSESRRVSPADVALQLQGGELIAVHKDPKTNSITIFNYIQGGQEQ